MILEVSQGKICVVITAKTMTPPPPPPPLYPPPPPLPFPSGHPDFLELTSTSPDENGFMRLKLNSNLKKQLQSQPKSSYATRQFQKFDDSNYSFDKMRKAKKVSILHNKPDIRSEFEIPLIIDAKNNRIAEIPHLNAADVRNKTAAKVPKYEKRGQNANGGNGAFPKIASTSAKERINSINSFNSFNSTPSFSAQEKKKKSENLFLPPWKKGETEKVPSLMQNGRQSEDETQMVCSTRLIFCYKKTIISNPNIAQTISPL